MAEPARDLIILGFRQSFYTKVVRGPKNADGSPGPILSKEENVPDYWVKYVNKGMPQSAATEDRLRHMDPANLVLPEGAEGGTKQAFLEHRWSQIKPAFDAWIQGQQLPEYGIPLAAWPALNPEQIKALMSMGVKSIEDVRDLSENQIGKIRLPNIRDLKKLAGMYIEQLDVQQAAEREQARDAEIEGLKEQIAAMTKILEQQAAAEKKSTKTKEAA